MWMLTTEVVSVVWEVDDVSGGVAVEGFEFDEGDGGDCEAEGSGERGGEEKVVVEFELEDPDGGGEKGEVENLKEAAMLVAKEEKKSLVVVRMMVQGVNLMVIPLAIERGHPMKAETEVSLSHQRGKSVNRNIRNTFQKINQ